MTISQLAIAWCLQNPNVSSVITGASKPEKVIENMQSIEYAERLTPNVMDQIEDILDNQPKTLSDFRYFSSIYLLVIRKVARDNKIKYIGMNRPDFLFFYRLP
jgi:hypothetical protein